MAERGIKCRFCNAPLTHIFVDLGHTPPSNSLLNLEDLSKEEKTYPLKADVCDKCWLVQVDHTKAPAEIFNGSYPYFSSSSQTWNEHCKRYADKMADKLSLNEKSKVIEVASNDGCLLIEFAKKGIPVLGIDPATLQSKIAEEKGIETINDFFSCKLGIELKRKGITADLMIANNVLAHVPDINDFLEGFKRSLKENGVITFEFPHLMNLIRDNQFDTIYQEHYSYFSFGTVKKILNAHDFEVFDVEELPIHGGSLRVYAQKQDSARRRPVEKRVKELLGREEKEGMQNLDYYKGFQTRVNTVKNDLIRLLIDYSEKGKHFVGYGAAAKGNTLLNYAGIKPDLLSYVADTTPAKQGMFLPGSHIPIVHPDTISKTKPDAILILPWNFKDECMRNLAYTQDWGAEIYVAIPKVSKLEKFFQASGKRDASIV